jgi:hypothetical protein
VGGSVQGDVEQVRIPGVSGSPVTAVPNDHQYAFLEWSDGSTDNPRTDLKVMSDLSVTATFIETNIIGVSTFADLDNICNDRTADYILLNDIDASGTADPSYNGGEGWLPIGRVGGNALTFFGTLDGQGYTISGLTFDRPDGAPGSGFVAGLFGRVGVDAVISNLHLVDVDFLGHTRVGGIVGELSGGAMVLNCSVSGSLRGQDAVGGLVGSQPGGTIENCWTHGEVESFGTSQWTGGLVGDSESMIRRSYSTSDVTGGGWVGGLVGRADLNSTIEESFAAGDVAGISTFGALAGAQSGQIARCYATGNATGLAGSFGVIGGIVGRQEAGSELQDSFARGDVTGTNIVGGVVGSQIGGSTMSRCYSTGAIPSASSVGGLLGLQQSGTVTVSYWDVETSGIATSAGGAEAFGRTTPEMTTPFGVGVYTGWDFATVWIEEDESNGGYPFHRWVVPQTLNYAAGAGGSLDGDLEQMRIPGLSGTSVTAVPNEGFEFVKWSDDSTENPRQDLKVVSNVNVTAIFLAPNAVQSMMMIY